jgi:hypothetical protein
LLDAFGGITVAQAVLDTTETEEEKKRDGTGDNRYIYDL